MHFDQCIEIITDREAERSVVDFDFEKQNPASVFIDWLVRTFIVIVTDTC